MVSYWKWFTLQKSCCNKGESQSTDRHLFPRWKIFWLLNWRTGLTNLIMTKTSTKEAHLCLRTIDVKIGRVLFEKQTGEELYDAAIGLKELFDRKREKRCCGRHNGDWNCNSFIFWGLLSWSCVGFLLHARWNWVSRPIQYPCPIWGLFRSRYGSKLWMRLF